ncbi:MAG: Gfo/Idh/MocA family oxidoreductase [Chloroflexi bacterium]|nr:Gfo/Idh/MocA family oxidoreductase [Chloroflexota bacterium]
MQIRPCGVSVRTIHVGVGGRGRWPIEVLGDDPHFQPVALVDVVPAHLTWARERSGLPESACFGDIAEALRQVEADALVIATPTRTHAAFCRAGFAAGKHVLVEKGMTLNWREAQALVREADQAGVAFCVSQNYRYQSQVVTLQQTLTTRRYGTPHLIDLICHRHRPEPRTLDYPGAMVWDMGCHHFDNLVSLFGSVAEATAVTHNAPWSAYQYDAGISAVLQFAAGPVCTYELTHQAAISEYRWLVQSDTGALRLAGNGNWEWLPRGERRQFAAHGAPEELPAVPVLRSEQRVVDDWYAFIREGKEPGISGHNNLETLAICEMTLRAASLRRTVTREEVFV